MKSRFAVILAAVLIGTACGDVSQITNVEVGTGGGDKVGFTVSPPTIDANIGSCSTPTLEIIASMPILWSPDGSDIYSLSVNTSTLSSKVVLTKKKAGSGYVTGTNPNDKSKSVRIPVKLSDCPTTGGGSTGVYRFKSVAPSDTTVKINTRANLRILAEAPSGKSTDILVRSTGCIARGSAPVATATSVANEHSILVDLVGISTACTDWKVVLKFAGDTTVTTTVTWRVVALAGITISPPGPISGPVGMTGFHTCQVTGMADLRCWFYSTDVSRGAIVQKDTTFATNTIPWGTGFHFGGEWRHIWPGPVSFCAFSPSQPSVAACALHNVTSSSVVGNVLVGSGAVLAPADEIKEFHVPKVIRELLKIPE